MSERASEEATKTTTTIVADDDDDVVGDEYMLSIGWDWIGVSVSRENHSLDIELSPCVSCPVKSHTDSGFTLLLFFNRFHDVHSNERTDMI